ncbi:hypothetical protein H4R35_004711 [Dimargaris xerosporica]|nr:hypothetical protein H4R35_004711 [Dimargaris xerosporica]
MALGSQQAKMAKIITAFPMTTAVPAATSLPHLTRRQMDDSIGDDYSRAIVSDVREQLEDLLSQRDYQEVIQTIRETYMDVLLFCGTAFELKAHIATLTTLAKAAGNEPEFETGVQKLITALEEALADAEQQHYSCPAEYLRGIMAVINNAKE